MFKKIIISTLLAAAAFSAQAKESVELPEVKVPFDIKMGDKVDDVVKRAGLNVLLTGKFYSLEGVKNAPPIFKAVSFTHKRGGEICEITFIGDFRESLANDLEIENDYLTIVAGLNKRYGVHSLNHTPTKHGNKLLAVYMGETWFSAWHGDTGNDSTFTNPLSRFKGPVSFITVRVSPTANANYGYTVLNYTLKNHKECSDELVEDKMTGL